MKEISISKDIASVKVFIGDKELLIRNPDDGNGVARLFESKAEFEAWPHREHYSFLQAFNVKTAGAYVVSYDCLSYDDFKAQYEAGSITEGQNYIELSTGTYEAYGAGHKTAIVKISEDTFSLMGFYEDGGTYEEVGFENVKDLLESVRAYYQLLGQIIGTATDNPRRLIGFEARHNNIIMYKVYIKYTFNTQLEEVYEKYPYLRRADAIAEEGLRPAELTEGYYYFFDCLNAEWAKFFPSYCFISEEEAKRIASNYEASVYLYRVDNNGERKLIKEV